MEKQLAAFHKPNSKNMTNGSALQITRNARGLNLQLARQMTQGAGASKATYNWNEDSFSALLNLGELSKIAVAAKQAEQEVNRAKLLGKLIEGASLDQNELKTVKLPHMNSTAPKTINVKFKEYPTGTGSLTLEISFYGTMSFFKDGKRQFKENQNLAIYLSEDETNQFLSIINNELQGQLEDNFVASKVVNLDEQDAKGHNGFKTINDFRSPILSVGDIVSGIRKDLMFEVVRKEFDSSDSKMVYYCKKVVM